MDDLLAARQRTVLLSPWCAIASISMSVVRLQSAPANGMGSDQHCALPELVTVAPFAAREPDDDADQDEDARDGNGLGCKLHERNVRL